MQPFPHTDYRLLELAAWAFEKLSALGAADGVPGRPKKHDSEEFWSSEDEYLSAWLRDVRYEIEGRKQAHAILASDQTTEEKFEQLARLNFLRAGMSSRLADHFGDPSYRAIIELGSDVVPVLLRKMRDDPGWWNHALREITGANPEPKPEAVAPGFVGYSLDDIAKAWVLWGREHGYDV